MVTSLHERIRRLSNRQTIKRIIFFSTIPWLLFCLHSPIGFRSEASGCVPSTSGFYSTFYVISNIILTIVPLIMLISFTTVTFQRIISMQLRRMRTQTVHPVEVQANLRERISNKNLHMIRLNLIQVIAFIVLNLPNVMYSLYSFFTKTNQKTSDQIIIDNFYNYIASYLLYTHCAVRKKTLSD